MCMYDVKGFQEKWVRWHLFSFISISS